MAKKDERYERPNREKDKRGGKAFKEFPKTDRKRCRVMNLESPGDQIEAAVNGVNFIVQHDSVVDLHESQINCLRSARVRTSEYTEDPSMPGKFTSRPITIPRIMVEVLGDAPSPAKKGQVPPAEQAPSKDNTIQGVLSGR